MCDRSCVVCCRSKLRIAGKNSSELVKYSFKNDGKSETILQTVDSLRLSTFQTFEMRIPPTIEEQTAIAAILSDMDAEDAALEAQLAKSRDIKQGMMQELLTGKIRLV